MSEYPQEGNFRLIKNGAGQYSSYTLFVNGHQIEIWYDTDDFTWEAETAESLDNGEPLSWSEVKWADLIGTVVGATFFSKEKFAPKEKTSVMDLLNPLLTSEQSKSIIDGALSKGLFQIKDGYMNILENFASDSSDGVVGAAFQKIADSVASEEAGDKLREKAKDLGDAIEGLIPPAVHRKNNPEAGDLRARVAKDYNYTSDSKEYIYEIQMYDGYVWEEIYDANVEPKDKTLEEVTKAAKKGLKKARKNNPVTFIY